MSNVLTNKKDLWDPYFYNRFQGYQGLWWLWQSYHKQFKNWPTVEDFNALFQSDFSFVLQNQQMCYEWEIFNNHAIPMREFLWHDFFNNLTWVLFPKIKWALIEKICSDPVFFTKKERTSQQNLITHLDEYGMVICAKDPKVFCQIKNFEWKKLFFQNPSLISNVYPLVIGHGLLEKSLMPFIGLTGKAIFLQVPQGFFDLNEENKQRYIDNEIAEYIRSDTFPKSPKALYPFPILGWPKWHKNNANGSFFENTKYFRVKRNIPEGFAESAWIEGKNLSEQ